MCSAPSNGPQYWREKYLTAVREQEEAGTAAERAGRTLCRAAIRLTLATSGLDPLIDPYLTRIRDLLRKGFVDKRQFDELDALSETLLRESKSAQGRTEPLAPSAALLFRFLKETAADSGEQSTITALEAKVERGEISEAGTLLSALRDELRHRSADAVEEGIAQRLFARLMSRSSKAPEAWLDADLVRARLLDMLEAIEIPVPMAEVGISIKARLRQGVTADQMPALINEAIDFLSEMRGHIQREQQEIDSFLALLNGRLTDLEHQAVGMDVFTQGFAGAREAEDELFSQGVRELKATLRQTPDPVQCVALSCQRLTRLDSLYQANRSQELERQRQTQTQISQLTDRLQDLELETNDLRGKLRLAHDLALRDPLTGLPNRKAYDDRIAQEIARWKRFQQPFSLLVWDIDRFKDINDRYGHAAGDKVLVNVARELTESIRETDLAARFGGEEFVMILCGADGKAAQVAAEHIRERIARCGFNSHGRPVAITISGGMTEYRDGDAPLDLFERADQALYAAKQGGRNRCVLS